MPVESVSGVKSTDQYQSVTPVKATAQVEKMEAYANNSTVQYDSKGQSGLLKQAEGSENGNISADKKEKEQVMESSMKSVSKDMNKLINRNTVAEFGYHEGTHTITIKIKDKDTNEVIKEIPSEKALDMLEKAWELAGMLVDEKR